MWKLIRNRNPATSPRRGVALQSLEGLPSHVVAGAIASRACDCKKEGSRKRRQKVARFGAHFTQIITSSAKSRCGTKIPCLCLVTPDLFPQHGAGESLGDSPRCPVISAVRNTQEIIEKTVRIS